MLGPLLADPPIASSSLDTGCGVNLRDGIAEGEATTALQFTTVMAGCRLFYVLGDVLNVSYTWERVARGWGEGTVGDGMVAQLTGTGCAVGSYGECGLWVWLRWLWGLGRRCLGF